MINARKSGLTVFKVLLVAMVLFPLGSRSSPAADMPKSAFRFIDSVGVNTHFAQRRSPYYLQYEGVRNLLYSSGIRHIRDGAIDSEGGFSVSDQASRFRELGRAGIRAIYIFDVDTTAQFITGFPDRVSPSFIGYEGPNEPNLGGTSNWQAVVRNWMPKFYSYANSSSFNRNFPVIGPSLPILRSTYNPYQDLGNISSSLDLGNLHIYLNGRAPGAVGWGGYGLGTCGTHRYATIAFGKCYASAASGSRQIYITETGYGSQPSIPGQLPPDIQAKYIVRYLLSAFMNGIGRTYIYQLVDSGGSTDNFRHYGLAYENLQPKPSYKALRGLLSLLADDPSGTMKPLELRVQGNTSNVQRLLLQKSDGTYFLIMWLEVSAYNVDANGGRGAEIGVPTQAITLKLPANFRQVTQHVFDDSGAFASRSNNGTVTGTLNAFNFDVSDNITVLSFR